MIYKLVNTWAKKCIQTAKGQDLGDLIQKRFKSCIQKKNCQKKFPTYPWNIPPKPPTNMKEFLSFWELGDAWGMLQGYVGVRTSP